jgi:hypothetical protein
MTRPNRFLFDEAISALHQRKGRTIVEVGAIRNRAWRDTDGHSTLRWPVSTMVWSVDTDSAAIRLTRELTADRPNVLCVLADALAFLQSFPSCIDLLYLDGPHPDHEDGRRWHLDAYRRARMSEHSVVLIDDTDLPNMGKAELVVPAARADGFHLLASDRQTLLVR